MNKISAWYLLEERFLNSKGGALRPTVFKSQELHSWATTKSVLWIIGTGQVHFLCLCSTENYLKKKQKCSSEVILAGISEVIYG
ncbi:hypothetical protein L345_00847, partial [Ophiophagus hannah]